MPPTRQPPGHRPGGAHDDTDRAHRSNSDGSSEQLTLEHARLTDPPTSHAAARSLDPKRVGRQVADVMVSIATRKGGAITADVAADLDRDRGCVARRITDAARRGLVRPDGVRTAPSGRLQTVWRPTSAGLDVAAKRIAETS